MDGKVKNQAESEIDKWEKKKFIDQVQDKEKDKLKMFTPLI